MNQEEIIKKAWELYYSEKKEEIADYTQYDALFEIVGNNDTISDEDYTRLMKEMECF